MIARTLALENNSEPVDEMLVKSFVTSFNAKQVFDEQFDGGELGFGVGFKVEVRATPECIDSVIGFVDHPVGQWVVAHIPDRDVITDNAPMTAHPMIQLRFVTRTIKLQFVGVGIPQTVEILSGFQVTEGEDQVAVFRGGGGQCFALLNQITVVRGGEILGFVPGV